MYKRTLFASSVLLSILLVSLAAGEFSVSEKQELLDAHNKYRAEVNVTSLSWSDALAAQAQQCADYNAANFLPNGTHQHCPTPGIGQNIAQSTSRSHLNLTQMINLWGNEKRFFTNGEYPSVSATGYPDAVSHYTQVIWQNTGQVGCGKASSGGYDILVCDYTPQGNINGTSVYSPPRPPVVNAGETNEYIALRNNSFVVPERNIITNTVFNRPVSSCYQPAPV